MNSGRYAVEGERRRLQMGDGETLVLARPQGGRVTINTVLHVRQQPRDATGG